MLSLLSCHGVRSCGKGGRARSDPALEGLSSPTIGTRQSSRIACAWFIAAKNKKSRVNGDVERRKRVGFIVGEGDTGEEKVTVNDRLTGLD